MHDAQGRQLLPDLLLQREEGFLLIQLDRPWHTQRLQDALDGLSLRERSPRLSAVQPGFTDQLFHRLLQMLFLFLLSFIYLFLE